VTYFLDIKNNCIRYSTARDISEGEELCIFYGHNLWFTPADILSEPRSPPETDDGWGGLMAIEGDPQNKIMSNPYAQGDPETIISEEGLPFVRFKPPPEEEDAESIQTGISSALTNKMADSSAFLVQAWVVDIPDPRHITTLLKYAPYFPATPRF
jgi:tRNA-specific adenosine deaminase 3